MPHLREGIRSDMMLLKISIYKGSMCMWTFYLSMLDNEEDKITFERLYDRCRLKCYRVALKITNNHELAEDAIHNAFLAVIKQFNTDYRLSNGEFVISSYGSVTGSHSYHSFSSITSSYLSSGTWTHTLYNFQ